MQRKCELALPFIAHAGRLFQNVAHATLVAAMQRKCELALPFIAHAGRLFQNVARATRHVLP